MKPPFGPFKVSCERKSAVRDSARAKDEPYVITRGSTGVANAEFVIGRAHTIERQSIRDIESIIVRSTVLVQGKHITESSIHSKEEAYIET